MKDLPIHFHGTSTLKEINVLDVNTRTLFSVMLACQKRIGFVLNDNHFSMRTVYPPYSAHGGFGRQRKGRAVT